MLVSYSQNFEDVMLWRALKHVEQGYYIDVGAQDPVTDSVSQLFYEHGWRGIHVEATQTYANRLREARPEDMVVQAAVSDQAGSLEFFEIPDSGISTGDAKLASAHKARGFNVQKTRVPCILLRDVFDLARDREIHWLKVDVEGMERQVLASWLDSPILPWIVVVESTLPMTQQSSFEDWERYLLARQYTFAYFDGLNRFYISPVHPELAEAFSSGPNVFDGFSLSGSASNSLCARLQQQHEDEQARLRKELADARSQLTHTLAVQSSIWGNYKSLKAAAIDAAVREAEMTSEAGTELGPETSRAGADPDPKRGDAQSDRSRRKVGDGGATEMSTPDVSKNEQDADADVATLKRKLAAERLWSAGAEAERSAMLRAAVDPLQQEIEKGREEREWQKNRIAELEQRLKQAEDGMTKAAEEEQAARHNERVSMIQATVEPMRAALQAAELEASQLKLRASEQDKQIADLTTELKELNRRREMDKREHDILVDALMEEPNKKIDALEREIAALPSREVLRTHQAQIADLSLRLSEMQKAGNYEIQQKERFRAESSQLAERVSNLERQRFKLFNNLQLEEGPRALKLVLPVARIVRLFAGTKAPPA